MLREIKFKGKTMFNEWHYSEVIGLDAFWRAVHFKEIQSDSVKEFTGLRDLDGVDIYEGDIVRTFDDFINEVFFVNGSFGYYYDGEHKEYGFIGFEENSNFRWVDGRSSRIKVLKEDTR